MRRLTAALLTALLVGALAGTSAAALPAAATSANSVGLPGAEAWQARSDSLLGRSADQQTLRTDPAGKRLFTTSSVIVDSENFDTDFGVVAYATSDGSQLWQSTYGHSFKKGDTPVALDVSGDGSYVYVTGYSDTGLRDCDGCGRNTDYVTVAFAADTGRIVWVSHYDNGNEDSAFSNGDSPSDVTAGPNGVVYVTGRGGGPADAHPEMTTVAYDGATGKELWVTRYSRGHWSLGSRVQVSPDGKRVFVAGRDDGYEEFDEDVLAISLDAATGELLWDSHYNGPANNNDRATDMQVSPNGKLMFITGSTFGGMATSYDYLTLAYDTATGDIAWVSPWAPPGHQSEGPASLAVSPDGLSVYVTGTAEADALSNSGRDYATVAHDALTGTIRWATKYSSPGREADFAHGVVVSPDSNHVYVTGGAVVDVRGHRAGSFHTVAYQAHLGQEIWSASHRGEGLRSAAAFAVAVQPDGSKVYVTGVDQDKATTIAYCATPLKPLGTCAP